MKIRNLVISFRKIFLKIIFKCWEKKKIQTKIFQFFFYFNKKRETDFQDWGIFLWTAGRCKTVTFWNFRPRTVFLAFLTTLSFSKKSGCLTNFSKGDEILSVSSQYKFFRWIVVLKRNLRIGWRSDHKEIFWEVFFVSF